MTGTLLTAAYAAPRLALLAACMVSALAVAVHFRAHLPRFAAASLAVLLFGYAFFHRSFAYLGVPPVFVGEIVLASLVVAGLLAGRPTRILRSRSAIALVCFQLVGLTTTLPYIAVYGLESLRDAVLWAYGAVALAILALGQQATLARAVAVYGRFVPLFLCLVPAMIVAGRVSPGLTESLTIRGAAILDPKSGDVAVHLAGIAAYLGLRLHKSQAVRRGLPWLPEWIAWTLWLLSFGLISDNRGGMLAIFVGGLVFVVLSRRPARLWKPVVLSLFLVALATAWQVEVSTDRDGRSVSVSGIVERLTSAFVDTGQEHVDATKEWRLRWWSDIVGYTIGGEFRWLGKGYGINLADDDGYQTEADGSLRSPHNAHMTVLARSGVVGATAWLAFLTSLLLPLARTALAIDGERRSYAILLIVYLVAALVNASFDVYLEGPQGGLWFWALAGASMHLAFSSGRGQRLSGART